MEKEKKVPGKRGRKPKNIEVIDEVIETSEEKIENTIEEEVVEQTKVEEVVEQKMQEEVKKGLSAQAIKWKAWLKLHGLSPERFLEKYPNHPALNYVKELV